MFTRCCKESRKARHNMRPEVLFQAEPLHLALTGESVSELCSHLMNLHYHQDMTDSPDLKSIAIVQKMKPERVSMLPFVCEIMPFAHV